jgi:hypothetical protein
VKALDQEKAARKPSIRDRSTLEDQVWRACSEPGVNRDLVARATLLKRFRPDKDAGGLRAELLDLETEFATRPPSNVRIQLLEALAGLEEETGNGEAGLEYLRRSQVMRAALYGASSPEAAVGSLNVANALIASGRAAEGRDLATGAVQKLRQAQGPSAPSTLALQMRCAYALRRAGFEKEAADLIADHDKRSEGLVASQLRWVDRADE